MSKAIYAASPELRAPLGEWLRSLREERGLPLREVAEASGMDLAHLHKIEQGQRLPTEEQADALAKFFRVKAPAMQARRIAERFRHEFAGHPAANQAIAILAEDAGLYGTAGPEGRSR